MTQIEYTYRTSLSCSEPDISNLLEQLFSIFCSGKIEMSGSSKLEMSYFMNDIEHSRKDICYGAYNNE